MKVIPQYATLAAAAAIAGSAALVFSNEANSAPSFDEKALKKAIIDTIDAEEARRDNGTSIAPTYVRLAWHCAGTYSKADGSGGSNGCRMRFGPEAQWGANQGLHTARASLDPLKEKFPGLTCAVSDTLRKIFHHVRGILSLKLMAMLSIQNRTSTRMRVPWLSRPWADLKFRSDSAALTRQTERKAHLMDGFPMLIRGMAPTQD